MKSISTDRYKIGIFGSAVKEVEKTVQKAKKIGEELGKMKVIIITGASSGIPDLVATEGQKFGAEIWGFSPTKTKKDQLATNSDGDNTIYSKFFYVPKTYEFANNIEVSKKYRNVNSTATCDAGIIIAGRWGTLNEFTNLMDMGKVIGVLTKTGGIADELPKLCKKIDKKSKAKVFFNSNPKTLVKEVMNELKSRTKE